MIQSEADIKAAIQIELSRRPSIRLFNQVTGQFWRGEVIAQSGNVVTLKNACPVRSGVPGMSDLIGWRTMEVKPEDAGKVLAVFSALEIKSSKGRLAAEQFNFINKVIRSGGFAGVARSVQEALNILEAR